MSERSYIDVQRSKHGGQVSAFDECSRLNFIGRSCAVDPQTEIVKSLPLRVDLPDVEVVIGDRESDTNCDVMVGIVMKIVVNDYLAEGDLQDLLDHRDARFMPHDHEAPS